LPPRREFARVGANVVVREDVGDGPAFGFCELAAVSFLAGDTESSAIAVVLGWSEISGSRRALR
jgi:hypothetical protein